MKNLPVIGKILSILTVFGIFSVVCTAYTTNQMRFINTGYTHLRNGADLATQNLIRANVDFNTMHADIAQLMIDNSAAATQADLNDFMRFKARFNGYMGPAATEDPAEAANIQAIQSRAMQIVDGDCANAIKLASTATAAAALQNAQAAYLNECAPKFPGQMANAMALIAQNVKHNGNTASALTATTGSTIMLTYLAMFGGLIVVMLGSFFAIRAWITAPVNALQRVMGQLADGDLQASVVGTERKDEVGSMARSVQVFKDAGIEKERLEAEAGAQRAAAEQERQRVEAERSATAKEQEFVVNSVAAGLEKLSSGDLVFRLTTTFAGDYEKLRGDFNEAMGKLQETMQAIAANTQGVRSGAEEITQASDDLSRRTEQQAASLEETAAALDQITATVRRTAEVANEARDLVSTSKADAERSGDVVRQTVGAMDGIETSSKQITNIIGVIDEIAFQTNLLALNAGVEAARAGDAGRGFAVVATEVRALAQRSADAAKEIKALISTSGQQVATGVKLVSETGQALGRIAVQVTQLNGLVAELAASAKEQSTGLGEVNAAVNQMDQVTQQNAAMVEEATAASHGLSGEAHELARLIGQFRIGESAAAPVLKRAAPKTLPQKRVVTTSARNVVALPRKDEAKHPAMADASEGWNEF
jgi:methyl-accepting chemotaxis protein